MLFECGELMVTKFKLHLLSDPHPAGRGTKSGSDNLKIHKLSADILLDKTVQMFMFM